MVMRQTDLWSDTKAAWEFWIPSCIRECHRAVDQVIDRACEMGIPQKDSFALRNGLHEAIVNAVRHGNGQDPRKQVRIACHSVGRDFWFEVEDQGAGFDTTGVTDPCTEENRKRPGGRGLLLMRHFMNSVEYNERGNCVRMLLRVDECV